MIRPTVGRVVWYTPRDEEKIQGEPNDQVLAAIITYVWSDTMVNLMVMTPNGSPYGVTSVDLVQDGTKSGGRWCTWMPYQKGQAAKAEALEAKLVEQASSPVAPERPLGVADETPATTAEGDA